MKNCVYCFLDGTDACTRGAGRAVDDQICEQFIEDQDEYTGEITGEMLREMLPLDLLRWIREDIQKMHSEKPRNPYEMGKHIACGQMLEVFDKYIKEREAEE